MKQRDIYTFETDKLVRVPERREGISITNNKSAPDGVSVACIEPQRNNGILKRSYSVGSPGSPPRITVVFIYTHYVLLGKMRNQYRTQEGLSHAYSINFLGPFIYELSVTQRASCRAEEKSGHAPGC